MRRAPQDVKKQTTEAAEDAELETTIPLHSPHPLRFNLFRGASRRSYDNPPVY